jgi:hypothetical protein
MAPKVEEEKNERKGCWSFKFFKSCKKGKSLRQWLGGLYNKGWVAVHHDLKQQSRNRT